MSCDLSLLHSELMNVGGWQSLGRVAKKKLTLKGQLLEMKRRVSYPKMGPRLTIKLSYSLVSLKSSFPRSMAGVGDGSTPLSNAR
jgi:hypothetical protein